jgi:hypothetical protein
VAIVFFDTSAVIHRYDDREPGARQVRALCSRRNSHTLIIARITGVETASAFNRKLREQAWTAGERDRVWRLFRVHCRRQYQIVSVDDVVYRRAESLLSRHPLRAYDALQLAAALSVRRVFIASGLEFRFSTADARQADAARAEGLTVEFIR